MDDDDYHDHDYDERDDANNGPDDLESDVSIRSAGALFGEFLKSMSDAYREAAVLPEDKKVTRIAEINKLLFPDGKTLFYGV